MAWELTGNDIEATDFLGTKNDQPLVIRTKNVERMRITPDGRLSITASIDQLNVGGPAGDGIVLTNNLILGDNIFGGLISTRKVKQSLNLATDGERICFYTTGDWFTHLLTPSMVISKDGDVGIGTHLYQTGEWWSVDAKVKGKLHIASDGGWDHPQLRIEQTAQDGWARIRLHRANKETGDQVGKYWDIAVGGSTNSEVMNFYSEQNNSNIMTLTHEGTVNILGDIVLTNADCAEEFDIKAAAEVEPGSVKVLDCDGVLRQSTSAYDKRVAGVISGGGDYQPGIILDKQQVLPNRKPVALVGKVYCKVDAGDASIEVGDLLTTSSTPGHAMKADDPLRIPGAVIGKALRGLPSGQGLIPILVALQ